VPGARVASLHELGQRLAAFLDTRNEVVELCYDFAVDWELLEGALRAAGRWDELARRLRPHNVSLETCSEEGDAAAQAVFDDAPDLRHHALTDACALRARWPVRPALDTSDFGRVRAYLGYGGPDDRGNTLLSTLAQDNDWFEEHRYFLLWTFPVSERSQVKQDAPLLTAAEFQRLADDEHVRQGVQNGALRLLYFLGLRLDEEEGGVVEDDRWGVDWRRWARSPGHNDMRVSRMLRCLSLTGQGELAKELYAGLERLVRECRGADAAEPALAFWRAAAYR
jgi:hypothetical protein